MHVTRWWNEQPTSPDPVIVTQLVTQAHVRDTHSPRCHARLLLTLMCQSISVTSSLPSRCMGGRCRSLMQVGCLYRPEAVDAVWHGCCTLLLHQSSPSRTDDSLTPRHLHERNYQRKPEADPRSHVRTYTRRSASVRAGCQLVTQALTPCHISWVSMARERADLTKGLCPAVDAYASVSCPGYNWGYAG
jgi:hypothetical protein